jgi:GT2 family glycosyltransferase
MDTPDATAAPPRAEPVPPPDDDPAPRDAPPAGGEEAPAETGGDGGGEAPAPAPAAPAVVAVLVTTDPGPWLEAAVASLGAQDYPALSVLVLDSGSGEDPTPRIAAAAPHAFVRRLPRDAGFAAAANEVMTTVEGATFLLFCHDDVVLAPDTVRVMVEEAYRSNAAIVGPKLVDYERPDVLLEVGMAVDHYGVPFSGIEPGEIDQEQHDAVRDVFYVSTAAMLVRSDLFRELGGFDPATSPGFDDVDLCWRARLAGARVLVAPDARVRHRLAAAPDAAPSASADAAATRSWTHARVRMLAKSYSALALVWVLPVALALNVAEATALAVSRQPRRARALLGGWLATLRQVGDVRRARAATQALRRIDDGDVRDLMVRGSARIRSFLTHRLHAGDRIAEMSTRTRVVVARAGTRVRGADVALGAALVLLLAVGSRSLVLDRVPEVGGFRAWPGAGPLWSAFWSPWRYAMVGADAPGPPAFGLMAALSALLLGDSDLGRTLVVAGAFPLGAFGAYRLARPLAASTLPAVVAAVAYAANPVVRNALGEGRLGPLVTYALAPFTLAALLRASGGDADRRARVHATLSVALTTAVAAAAWPPALLLAPLLAVAFVVAVPFTGGARVALRALAAACAAAAAAFVVLLPWSAGLLGADAGALGALPQRAPALTDVLSFQTGRAGSGLAPWGLVVAALAPLGVATGARLAWAGRAWVLAALSWALVWVPGRLDAEAPLPAHEGLLVPAALALALAVGLGAAAFVEELRRFHFGWRQLATVVAGAGLVLPLLGLAADTRQGRWGLGHEDWAGRFAWMQEDVALGGFRVLWLGDPSLLPTDAHVVDGVGYGLTRDGVGDARSLWAPPRGDAERVLAEAVALARDGRTVRLGHLLAPASVRYVALVGRAAPESGPRVRPDARLAYGLAGQLDLAISRVEEDAVVYENEAWVPRLAAVAGGTVPAAADDPLAAATATTLAADAVAGPRSHTEPVGPGTLLWSEAADGGWRARVTSDDGTRALERADAFGWTNAFAVTERGRVSLSFDAGPRRALVLVSTALWAAALVWWWRGRRAPAAGRAGERAE